MKIFILIALLISGIAIGYTLQPEPTHSALDLECPAIPVTFQGRIRAEAKRINLEGFETLESIDISLPDSFTQIPDTRFKSSNFDIEYSQRELEWLEDNRDLVR